jgi:hypothetical protein
VGGEEQHAEERSRWISAYFETVLPPDQARPNLVFLPRPSLGMPVPVPMPMPKSGSTPSGHLPSSGKPLVLFYFLPRGRADTAKEVADVLQRARLYFGLNNSASFLVLCQVTQYADSWPELEMEGDSKASEGLPQKAQRFQLTWSDSGAMRTRASEESHRLVRVLGVSP